jgi:hypothetical protein
VKQDQPPQEPLQSKRQPVATLRHTITHRYFSLRGSFAWRVQGLIGEIDDGSCADVLTTDQRPLLAVMLIVVFALDGSGGLGRRDTRERRAGHAGPRLRAL